MSRELLDSFKSFESGVSKRLFNCEEKIKDLEAAQLAPGFIRRNTAGLGTENKGWRSPGEYVTAAESFKTWQAAGFAAYHGGRKMVFTLPSGFFPPESKLIDSGTLGSGTSGVLMPDRDPRLTGIARQPLRIRDVLDVRTTTASAVDALKQDAFTNLASPQIEGQAKSESDLTLDVVSSPVRTIAHYFTVTRQALDDVPGFRRDLDSLLIYGLKVKEESQILAGDGLGVNLDGIITQGTSYDTSLNVADDTKLDKLRHAIFQLEDANEVASALILNPRDIHDIELIKTEDSGDANTGTYIVGNPLGGVIAFRTLWRVPVVSSKSISPGTFLVGNFIDGATLYDRQVATIDISFEHANSFTENKAVVRGEERIALAVKRESAFVTGSF